MFCAISGTPEVQAFRYNGGGRRCVGESSYTSSATEVQQLIGIIQFIRPDWSVCHLATDECIVCTPRRMLVMARFWKLII